MGQPTENRQPQDLAPRAPDNLAAFHAFYQTALPRIYGYLYHRCGLVSVAEDLTQDTFLVAVAEINAGNAAVVSLPWLLGVARHKLIARFRTQAREERKLSLVWRADKADATRTGEEPLNKENALAALAGLSAPQRQALVLRYFDDQSVPEVARIIGKSIHATESLLARGRRAFRARYEELPADD
jgi:RNA polymerase sigma-70 factor (ECF subfamily)